MFTFVRNIQISNSGKTKTFRVSLSSGNTTARTQPRPTSSKTMLHQVELVVNARENLRNSRGVRDHAAGAHDFGQVTPWYHSGRLIIDAALEASGAPIHELNGTCTCAETIMNIKNTPASLRLFLYDTPPRQVVWLSCASFLGIYCMYIY